MVTCTFCGREVDAKRAYRKVTGWEQPRSGGGANQITLRKPLDVFACTTCIHERKLGIAKDQEALW